MNIDEFDDFELMILVHEAVYENMSKQDTCVRITAGAHSVTTDYSSKGVWQQPLHITVEQGTVTLETEFLDRRGRVLAKLNLDSLENVLRPTEKGEVLNEMMYEMKTKSKGIIKPKIKLTLVVQDGTDEEIGLLGPATTDVDILVRQELQKAKQKGESRDEVLNEMQVLKEACSGPLELFEGLGTTNNVYVAAIGPPESRRWILGIWKDKKDFLSKKPAQQEIDLLKVETVKGDPTRHHVFVVNAFDSARNRRSLTFRRVDRARDVWVEILHLLVLKARAAKKARKDATRTATSTFTSSFTGSQSMRSAGTDSSRPATFAYGSAESSSSRR